MEQQKKIGVFLARFQPLHNAHLYVIEKALEECDELVIMLGSSNKNNMLRNPFDFNLRYNLLKDSLQNIEDMERISIYELPDWSQESNQEDNLTWGSYLYYNVVSRINQKTFTIYYSDQPEYLLSWFTDEIKSKISCRFLERSKIFEGLSATKIREALLNFSEQDQKYLKECLPPAVFSRVNELRGIWLDVSKNPQKDFSMK